MVDTEKAIIGSILTDESVFSEIMNYIKPYMFSTPIACALYTLFLQMYGHEKIEILPIIQQAESAEIPQEVVAEYVKECISGNYTSSSIKQYGNMLIQEYRSREIKKAVEKLTFMPNKIQGEIADLMAECERLRVNDKPRYSTVGKLAKKNKDAYFREHEVGLKSGLAGLDEYISFEKKDVTIIGARPAVGKSAFALWIGFQLAKKGKRVGIFNLEMSDKQIFERLVASQSGIDLVRIRKAKAYLKDEEERFNKAIDKLTNLDNMLIFSGSYTAGEIKAECVNQNFDLVIIDYLQLVKADKSYSSRVAEVGDISKTIKAMAMDLNIPVIALSQLNRMKKATEEPEMSDLRESGDIEQDASTILFMWNIDDDGHTKGLKVEKNRQGELTKIGLEFNGKNMEFKEIPFEQTKARKGFKKISNDNPFGASEDM